MNTSPMKAIRAKCMDCTGGQFAEIAECAITDCPLYAFQYGKNPYHKRASPKTRAKALSKQE